MAEGDGLRTVIVRLVEPEQAGGELRGMVEPVGGDPVPFHGADALVRLVTAVAHGGPPRAAGAHPERP